MSIETKGREQIEANLARLRDGQSRRNLSAVCGKRVEVGLRKHFTTRPKNKRGWKSQRFWPRIRNATSLTAWDEESATISIADPAMNQKVHGGTIRPVEGKMLTIPARPEAAGRSPRTFSNLAFIPLPDFRQGRGVGRLVGLLVEKAPDRGFVRVKRKKGQTGRTEGKTMLKVYYYCVAAVYQAPDRDALPKPEVVGAWVLDEADKFFQRELKRGGGR